MSLTGKTNCRYTEPLGKDYYHMPTKFPGGLKMSVRKSTRGLASRHIQLCPTRDYVARRLGGFGTTRTAGNVEGPPWKVRPLSR